MFPLNHYLMAQVYKGNNVKMLAADSTLLDYNNINNNKSNNEVMNTITTR